MGKLHKLRPKQANSRDQAITVPWRVSDTSCWAQLCCCLPGAQQNLRLPMRAHCPSRSGREHQGSLDTGLSQVWIRTCIHRCPDSAGSWLVGLWKLESNSAAAPLRQRMMNLEDWNRVLGHRLRVLGKAEQRAVQNWGLFEVGGNYWRLSCSTSFSGTVTSSSLPWTMSRQLLNFSRIFNLSQCSVTLTIIKKKIIKKNSLLMFTGYFLCFKVCQLPLLLSLWTSENSLAPWTLQLIFLSFCSEFRNESFILLGTNILTLLNFGTSVFPLLTFNITKPKVI